LQKKKGVLIHDNIREIKVENKELTVKEELLMKVNLVKGFYSACLFLSGESTRAFLDCELQKIAERGH